MGGGEVTLLEHTSAFATFAREGVYHPVVSILKIEDNNGKILEEYEEREEQVFNTESVRTLNSVLSDDSARAYVFGAGGVLTLPGRSVAAKTGHYKRLSGCLDNWLYSLHSHWCMGRKQ